MQSEQNVQFCIEYWGTTVKKKIDLGFTTLTASPLVTNDGGGGWLVEGDETQRGVIDTLRN